MYHLLDALEACRGSLKLPQLKLITAVRSGRRIRKAIEALRDAGKPIGSSARRGYFMIRTRDDWNEAVHEFQMKAMACLRMKSQLEKIGADMFTDQQTLKFGDAAGEGERNDDGNHLDASA